jgi:recombination protein RecA
LNEESVKALPTGFPRLDRALAIGGLPRGRITEIFGPANSGKTGLALQIVAHVQRSGGAAAWIDAEHAFDAKFAVRLGVDLGHLAIAEPESAEQAFAMARRFLESDAIDMLVIDSAAALIPQLELETEIGGASAGLHGRVLGSELRRLAPAAARHGAAVVFLNQVRSRLDSPSGEPETTAGGAALKLYAATRIQLGANGRLVRFRILKNRCGAAFASGEFEWRPDCGFAECP